MTIAFGSAYRQSDQYSGPAGNVKGQILTVNIQKETLVVGDQTVLLALPGAAILTSVEIRHPAIADFAFDLGFQVQNAPATSDIDALADGQTVAVAGITELITGPAVSIASVLSVSEDASVFLVITPTVVGATPADQELQIIWKGFIDRP